MGLSANFTLRVPAKSTLGALLIPLFGQFQKLNSRKFCLLADASATGLDVRSFSQAARRLVED